MGSTQALKNQRAWLVALAKAKARERPSGAAAASPAGTPGGSAAPAAGGGGSTTPRATPFYNAQDLIDLANLNFDTTTGVEGIDQQLADLGVDTTYQQGQIDTSAKKNTSGTNDDAAGRGIFGSSIQQGAIADIEANRVIQRGYLDDKLKAAKIAGGARKSAILKHATDVIGGLDQKAVGNADEINRQIPGDTPAQSPPAAPAVPDLIKQWQDLPYTSAAGTNSKGVQGVWHHYKDGRPPVFVAGATR